MRQCDKMTINNRKKGFTLIELSLSIAFIAVLSLAVVLIIANSISAYHRGLVLNQINTNGMELVDEMRATIQNAPVVSLESMCEVFFENKAGNNALDECKDTEGGVLVSSRKTAKVLIDKNNKNSETDIPVPVSGVFCTGNYSYIWNSGYFFNGDAEVRGASKIKFKYKDGEDTNKKAVDYNADIRLLKVKDHDRAVCAAFDADGDKVDITEEKYNAVVEKPVDLLSENSSLAFYDLYAPVPATNAMNNNMYYSISFVLGTLQGGANVTQTGNFCATPDGEDSNSGVENFDYCAINKFNFAAEAVGGEK